MRSSLDYAGFAQLCGRSPIMLAHNRIIPRSLVDSVVSVERHSERILIMKMVLGDRLLNVFMVYAPHSGRPDEEKECFW